jgi:hypothetical protein
MVYTLRVLDHECNNTRKASEAEYKYKYKYKYNRVLCCDACCDRNLENVSCCDNYKDIINADTCNN